MRTRQVFLRTFRPYRRTRIHLTSSCLQNSRQTSCRKNCLRGYRRRHGLNHRGSHRAVAAAPVIVRSRSVEGVSGVLQARLVELVEVYKWPAAGRGARQFPTLSRGSGFRKAGVQNRGANRRCAASRVRQRASAHPAWQSSVGLTSVQQRVCAYIIVA